MSERQKPGYCPDQISVVPIPQASLSLANDSAINFQDITHRKKSSNAAVYLDLDLRFLAIVHGFTI